MNELNNRKLRVTVNRERRFIVYEWNGCGWRLRHEHVGVSYTPDGNYIIYEVSGGVSIYNSDDYGARDLLVVCMCD